MLPVLPFLIGGALGAVAGVALKKYYDENDIEIHEKLENSLMDIEEWLDEKLVALDKYKDSLNLNDDENIISSTSCSSRFIRTGCRSDSDSFKVEIF